MMKKTGQIGFTLIEIVLALAIFAIISTLTTSVLYNVFSTRDRINKHSDRLAHLQVAVTLMQRDFEQMIDKPIIDIFGVPYPAIIASNDRVEFTRTGKPNPFGLMQQSSLQRVAYYLSDNQLIRQTWHDIDPESYTQVASKVLLNNINSIQFGYIGRGSYINNNWPPSDLPPPVLAPGRIPRMPIPRAIQVKFDIQNWGEMSILFGIPSTTVMQ